MTAWQRAKQWWDDNVAAKTFEQVLGEHISTGLVYATPQVFLLAREVFYDQANQQVIRNDDKDSNAWFVELAASVGNANPVREFMRVAPRARQWALWCRHNNFEIKAHQWAQLARKVRL